MQYYHHEKRVQQSCRSCYPVYSRTGHSGTFGATHILLAMPFLAIAWLVWWGHAENRLALGIVSMVGLLDLGVLFWAWRRTQFLLRIIGMLESD